MIEKLFNITAIFVMLCLVILMGTAIIAVVHTMIKYW
jgi:hypothetical protein